MKNVVALKIKKRRQVTERLAAALELCESEKARAFALVVVCADGQVIEGYQQSEKGEYFQLIGALEEVKRRIQDDA